MRIRVILLCLLGMAIVPSPSLAESASANLPLDSWVYPALEQLAGLGLIDSSLQGDRPFTRREAARQVAEARRKAMQANESHTVQRMLDLMAAELKQEMVEVGALGGVIAESYLKPLENLDLRYIYQDAQATTYPGTDASQSPLNFNNFGTDYGSHHTLALSLQTSLRWGEHLALSLRPLIQLRDSADGSTDIAVRLLEGRAALALGGFEVSIGRQALWWGQGRHGSLVLTNNAKPLDMLRLTNPTPLLLPWVLEHLGPFRFDFFVSRLERERAIERPYFGGLRLNIKPRPWLEIGASRTVMFGGEGDNITFDDLLNIIGGENLVGEEDNSNSVAALDARIRLPFLFNAVIYGELGGEDEADFAGFLPFLSNKAWLAGIFLPMIEPSKRLSLRVEYADLSHLDNNSTAWYRHFRYLSGYTFDGKLLGHHVGGAAKDYSFEIQALLPADFRLVLGYDYQVRGFDGDVREKHHQPSVQLDWQPTENARLYARYRADKVENFAFMTDNDRTFHLAEFGGSVVW